MLADLNALRDAARKTIETPCGDWIIRRLRAGDWMEILGALPIVPDGDEKVVAKEAAAARKALDVADRLLIAGVIEPALDAESVRVVPSETTRVLVDAIYEFGEFRPFEPRKDEDAPKDDGTS